MLLPLLVFVVAILVIASERMDRTVVALLGAGAVVVLGAIDEHGAVEAIEFEALGLLAGMMIAVRLLETTGIFGYIAVWAGRASRGRPFVLFLLLALVTGVLSAFLDNLTTVLLVIPVTLGLARRLELDPIPLVVMEVVASNLGGTATLIGDPPNILIGAATGLSFGAFIVNLAPVAFFSLVLVTGCLFWAQRGKLQIAPEVRGRLLELDPKAEITDWRELKVLGPAMLAIILAFFLHGVLHLGVATVALTGATIMLALSRQAVDDVLRGVDWATLLFFVGLFVMVGALQEQGALRELSEAITTAADGNRTAELLGIAWTAAIVGGIVDNIPLTAAMIPVVDDIVANAGGDSAYWWALALGACFGGNLTIVSAAANVAASGILAREGKPIGFIAFLKVGVPVTLGSMVIVTAYILLRYA